MWYIHRFWGSDHVHLCDYSAYYAVQSWLYFCPIGSYPDQICLLTSTCRLCMCPLAFACFCLGSLQWLFPEIACFQGLYSWWIFDSIPLSVLCCPFNSDRWAFPYHLPGCWNIWFSLSSVLSWFISIVSKLVNPNLGSPCLFGGSQVFPWFLWFWPIRAMRNCCSYF